MRLLGKVVSFPFLSMLTKGEGMYEIKYRPIGIVHSPFKEPKGTPIQPGGGDWCGGNS